MGITRGPRFERRLPPFSLLHDAPQPARLHPRHVYDSLRNQTDVADASEAGHMLERLAQVVFGAATIRGGRIIMTRCEELRQRANLS